MSLAAHPDARAPGKPGRLPIPGQPVLFELRGHGQVAARELPIQRVQRLLLRSHLGQASQWEFGDSHHISSRWQKAAHVEVAVVVEKDPAAVVELDLA